MSQIDLRAHVQYSCTDLTVYTTDGPHPIPWNVDIFDLGNLLEKLSDTDILVPNDQELILSGHLTIITENAFTKMRLCYATVVGFTVTLLDPASVTDRVSGGGGDDNVVSTHLPQIILSVDAGTILQVMVERIDGSGNFSISPDNSNWLIEQR